MMKQIPDKNITLFKSCLVSTEYPGIESSTKYVFDKTGIDYLVDERQTCCTGLGHYSDVFDQFSTTIIGARNFYLASDNNRKNMVMLCATCYAINKKVANILNKKDETREEVNEIFDKSDLSNMKYEKGSIDSTENIFHVVDILFNKKKEIAKNIKYDFSNFKIATHHGCHYCKVHYNDTIGGIRDPNIIDELVNACGASTIGWYDFKRTTCGAGFRQRFVNKDLSMDVTYDKLKALKNDDVEILVHLCPNCHVQFDRYQNYISNDKNDEFKTIHLNIAQFIALAMGADPYKVVGIQTHTVPVEDIVNKLETLPEYKEINEENKIGEENV
ncbi:CoB--CoM heterodisulfide reductase iron-sulfur subunit B family protein [Methanobrevibacter sp. OttesenSCG-928-K11]|nr:CoB--CoM heterodisulfide reductase iron-sulfur subunit B family protein [Methanobrevibacter sp. OttesenSCG-928-K11]MDL2270923.1 CoB--CoM heterodisulfide reductase iron-sulfur subunit B family protein [Methanobrevibacter sp. OttesenSCG-928-I08]